MKFATTVDDQRLFLQDSKASSASQFWPSGSSMVKHRFAYLKHDSEFPTTYRLRVGVDDSSHLLGIVIF
jgi:hypothetical protein